MWISAIVMVVGCTGTLGINRSGDPPVALEDAGAAAPDDGAPELDAPVAVADDGGEPPPPLIDAGPGMVDPVRPGDRMECFDFPTQRSAPGGERGALLLDVVTHLPEEYGDTYYDGDRITWAHETSHGIHAHLRNNFNDTGERANAFYVLGDRACLVVEPAIRKSDVAARVPRSLQGSRYDLYLRGSPDWDDTPLYVWDEWVAYTNGGEVGVDLVEHGLWTAGWRDGVAGQLEFTIYAIAVAMAVDELDPGYFDRHPQLLEFLAWNARRAMDLYRRGSVLEDFRWDDQDAYYRTIQESPDAADLRAYVRRTFGDTFANEVLGLGEE
jgi:hypothetical protein